MKVKRTTAVPKSEEVMAMFIEPMVSYRGKWQDIKITKVSGDEDLISRALSDLESRRKSLVGLTIPTIFSKEQLESQEAELPNKISDNSRLAYVPDVVNVLETAGKGDEARQLEELYPDFLDMYVAEGGIYELV